MIERIDKIIAREGISVRAFEQVIGASNGLIRKAIANKTDIQSKWLSAIADNYPHYSPEWLLTGKGSMLKQEENATLATVDMQQQMDLSKVKELDDKDIIISELKDEIKRLTKRIDRNIVQPSHLFLAVPIDDDEFLDLREMKDKIIKVLKK